MEEEQWAPDGERKRLRQEEEHKGQDEWDEAEGLCEGARKAAGWVDCSCCGHRERHQALGQPLSSSGVCGQHNAGAHKILLVSPQVSANRRLLVCSGLVFCLGF